jgi:glucose/arabinose dehydrogenase
VPRTPADHHDGARRQRKLTAARVLLTAVLLGGAACGGRTTEPPSPTPAPTPQPPDAPSGSTVSGNERIGWNQELVPETSANDYRFDVYVDADRTALGGVTCTPRANGLQAECSAPLPAMPAGRHDLRLVAIRQVGGAAHESLRSAPLPVVKLAAEPSAVQAPEPARGAGSADRRRSRTREPGGRVEVVSSSLGAVADIAPAADGRIFVAERGGRLVVLRHDGQVEADPALALSDVATRDGLGLFSVDLHPDFADNRLVYFAYAVETPGGPAYRIARGRELAGRIGQVSTLVDAAPAAPGGWAVIRFGRDGKLYAAFGRAPDEPASAGSYAGKILRLNDDGTTPSDNPGSSPVVAEGLSVPTGLAWAPDAPFLVQAAHDGRQELRGLHENAGGEPALFVWRASARPAGLAFRADAGRRAGEFLVSMLDGGVERLSWRSGGDSVPVIAGPRLGLEYGSVRAIAVAPDGTVYAGTANADVRPDVADRPERDFLLRLSDQ